MHPAHGTTPHPALRAHVSRYVQVALDLPPGEMLRHRLSALTGSVAAVVWSGQVTMDGIGTDGAGSAGRILPCSLIGPLTRWHDNVVAGPLRSFCVHFTPLGANALLHLEGCGFHDRAVALADLLAPPLGAEARAWADEVMHARGFAERVAATDRFLLRRLRRAVSRLDPVAAAVARIARSGVGHRVSALATELACSERTLRRRFREELGLSVKRFARITRFRRAHAFLQESPHASWAGAVVRFGYADQSHLIRDYREFAGTTPARFCAGERFLDAALTPGPGR
ncbi:MAG TPA: helix-turn-helix domain-containing protein [Longimicrobiales bacterium]|nr:helix-turn-helix domain-containing protein [Longimicrobiales bacterium]